MSVSRSIRRLSRAARLQCWVLAALGVLWTAPFVFRSFADESAAYGIRVEAALRAPTAGEWFGTDASGAPSGTAL